MPHICVVEAVNNGARLFEVRAPRGCCTVYSIILRHPIIWGEYSEFCRKSTVRIPNLKSPTAKDRLSKNNCYLKSPAG